MDRQTKARTHIKRGALYGAPLCVRELVACFILKLHNYGAVLDSQFNVFSREKENGKEWQSQFID
jgi:hypothetical protein